MGMQGRSGATGSGKATMSAKFATLGPLLLARKGSAKPAMRAQLGDDSRGAMSDLDDYCHAADLTGQDDMSQDDLGQDDLGWNDMGDDDIGNLPAPAVEPEVKRQQARLLHRIADANLTALQQADSAASRRAAFTLRLDQDRHLRLRLASTIAGDSAQNLVTRALDEFLARHPDIEHLAAQVRKPA